MKQIILLMLALLFTTGCSTKIPSWYFKTGNQDSFFGNAEAKTIDDAKVKSLDDLVQNIAVKITSKAHGSSISSSTNTSMFSRTFLIENLVDTVGEYKICEYSLDKGIFSSRHYIQTCIEKKTVANTLLKQIDSIYTILQNDMNNSIDKNTAERKRIANNVAKLKSKLELLSFVDSSNKKELSMLDNISVLESEILRPRLYSLKTDGPARQIIEDIVTASHAEVSYGNDFDYIITSSVKFVSKPYIHTNTQLTKATINIYIKSRSGKIKESVVFECIGEGKDVNSSKFNTINKLRKKVTSDINLKKFMEEL